MAASASTDLDAPRAVEGWRVEQLRRLGLAEVDAHRVACDPEVALVDALTLVRDLGCPPSLAAGILC